MRVIECMIHWQQVAKLRLSPELLFRPHIPVLALRRLIFVAQKFKITVCRSADEMLRIRPLWERLRAARKYSVFQNFDLNLLAATRFAEREEPYVVCAESEHGSAIVPAVLHRGDGTIRLLGE